MSDDEERLNFALRDKLRCYVKRRLKILAESIEGDDDELARLEPRLEKLLAYVRETGLPSALSYSG
jgi:hypothetical protein